MLLLLRIVQFAGLKQTNNIIFILLKNIYAHPTDCHEKQEKAYYKMNDKSAGD